MLSVYLIFKEDIASVLAFWIEDKFEIYKFFIVHFSLLFSSLFFNIIILAISLNVQYYYLLPACSCDNVY